MTLSLPPFTKAVKWLIGINCAVFLLDLILSHTSPAASVYLHFYGDLRPIMVTHGYVYQLVTYAFIHAGLWHLVSNMFFGLWMFGSMLEMDFGTRQFLEFYFWCAIGAGLSTVAVSYTHVLGVNPEIPTVGASGGIFGIFMAAAMLHGDSEVMLFPLPFTIRMKYFVGILVFLTFAMALGTANGEGASIAYSAHLGGLLFGWIYLKFLPRRGLRFFASERYYGVRNSYYRWKRKRAARKFEVYMRQHKREDYFDQYGNFKDPSERKDDKGNGQSSGGGWVN